MHFSGMRSFERADQLNSGCFCITGDIERVHAQLQTAADPARWEHLVSRVPVFVPRRAMDAMQAAIGAIERTLRAPAIRDRLLAGARDIARIDHGPIGAFMGYDFHLDGDTPRLIEINTNAGGAAINARLQDAQRACCDEVERQLTRGDAGFAETIVAMFQSEWKRQRGSGRPATIAIVDSSPETQFLYPEFVAIREFLEREGIKAIIADPLDLSFVDGRLLSKAGPIDIVYNRTTDFMLEEPENEALRLAYETGGCVVTPNPHNHALFADKRTLVLLSDTAALAEAGVHGADIEALGVVPKTVAVTPSNASELWERRREYFFKPVAGYGSKAVYRGDKLTRSVWASIAGADYVAQAIAPPGRRTIRIGEETLERKVDIRLYTYDGIPFLAAARLYQGQTTNFRTPGGGFAPVYVVGDDGQ